MEKLGRKTVWGKFTKEPDAKKLNYEWKENHSIDGEEFKRTIGYALSKAKDEILAESFAGDARDINRKLWEQAKKLADINGSYNYFWNIGICDKELLNCLHSEYVKILQKSTGIIADIAISYERWNLEKRAELFRWILVQIPMEEWEKALKDTLFIKESEQLDLLYEQHYFEMTSRIMGDSAATEDIKKMGVEIETNLAADQSKPLFENINYLTKKFFSAKA